ncbi:MAG: anion transporter [Chloroflexi bacterium]|nr:anion transporter [Chloroflexota bacterium]
MSTLQIVTLIVVTAAYAAIAVGSVPRLAMNRATIALVASVVLVLIGAISEQDALGAIDLGTILLLGAMMVINVHLRLAGFFRFVASRTLRLARTPAMLLALVIGASGVLSAFFLNDPICLMVTPLAIDIVRRFGRRPLPYLIGIGVAANVGSVATITGNPQNVIIGQASGIGYLDFASALTPVALVGLAISWAVIVVMFRDEFRGTLAAAELPPPRPYTPLLNRVLAIVVLLFVLFLIGVSVVTAACAAAGLLLISRLRPAKLLALDWELLAFFAGLFVVTGAIESAGLGEVVFGALRPLIEGGTVPLTLTTGVLSNLVSNVPAVLLMRPEVAALPDARHAWLTLAMASTLAGNLTLLGSAATLIVAEVARGMRESLGFMPFLRVGVPVTLLTIAFGVLWLEIIR